MKEIKILFIEPLQLLRKGLMLYLESKANLKVVHDCDSIIALNPEKLEGVDLILFDTESDDDYYTLVMLQQKHPNLKTILLSSKHRLFENYLFARTNNIDAFLSKEMGPDSLVNSIYKVALDGATQLILPTDVCDQLFGDAFMKEPIFSEKELNVLGLLGKGKTTREISGILNLSIRTIESHRRRMIERLGCRNIIPVILYGIKHNYIQIGKEVEEGFSYQSA